MLSPGANAAAIEFAANQLRQSADRLETEAKRLRITESILYYFKAIEEIADLHEKCNASTIGLMVNDTMITLRRLQR